MRERQSKTMEFMRRGREMRDLSEAGDSNDNNGYVTASSRGQAAPRRSSPPQSQHSQLAVKAILNNVNTASSPTTSSPTDSTNNASFGVQMDKSLMPPPKTVAGRALGTDSHHHHSPTHAHAAGVGRALTDTPVSTAPPSPQIQPISGTSTPGSRPRATTLDIPGLTKSKVSPDGRIAQRDVGSKLVIVMVGLPARGKSYITKKMARYLNWLQHDTKIFNVGERRRVHHAESAVSTDGSTDDKKSSIEKQLRESVREIATTSGGTTKLDNEHDVLPPPAHPPATILVNGRVPEETANSQYNPSPMTDAAQTPVEPKETLQPLTNPFSDNKETGVSVRVSGNVNGDKSKSIDQPASFFDPNNEDALRIREQVALNTLDELLDYILVQGGSVGILDATNSTLERRALIVNHIRERAGLDLNVLFLESQCRDENLLQANMRLKLSGPDYRGKDPALALKDFQNRVKLYEKSYVPLGDYEEKNNIPFVQVIDVSRKVVAHQVNGFLSSQVVYYLLNFNLSPRQIWITRHGESYDDVKGKIGGDADLSENGVRYADALASFMESKRSEWTDYQRRKSQSVHFPPKPGDSTPPNPQYTSQTANQPNFCVWTSMLKRAQQTVQFFDDEVYDVKEMRMLDEMNIGLMDGMTHAKILEEFPDDYERRKRQKLMYRYPGTGGEGYLDVINRLKTVIVEIERMTDHVLIVTHRSVSRVLLAYFLGLKREDLTDLDIPLGVVYCLEPKTYGVEFNMYRYNPKTNDFHKWSNDNFHRDNYR